MKSLDFYKFTSKDVNRKFMQGVFCENGYKVATDSKILVFVKADYNAAFEKKIVAKENYCIEGVFPAYKRVFPFDNLKEYENVDVSILLDMQKAVKANKSFYSLHKKISYIDKRTGGAFVKIKDSVFSIFMIEKVLHFFGCYPDSELYLSKDLEKMAYLLAGTEQDIKAMCLFMPCKQDVLFNTVEYNNIFYVKDNHYSDIDLYIKKLCKKGFVERQGQGLLTEKDKADIENIKTYLSVMSGAVVSEKATEKEVEKPVTTEYNNGMKINIYTSYYAKMAKRAKKDTDVYIQVSRTCYCPLKDLNNISVQSQIDYRFEDLGFFNCIEDYEEEMQDEIEDFADFLQPENWEVELEEGEAPVEEMNIFLLCFENLKDKWTKKDEEKYYNAKAGEYKFCHRTVLANILNKKYGYNIKEYEG